MILRVHSLLAATLSYLLSVATAYAQDQAPLPRALVARDQEGQIDRLSRERRQLFEHAPTLHYYSGEGSRPEYFFYAGEPEPAFVLCYVAGDHHKGTFLSMYKTVKGRVRRIWDVQMLPSPAHKVRRGGTLLRLLSDDGYSEGWSPTSRKGKHIIAQLREHQPIVGYSFHAATQSAHIELVVANRKHLTRAYEGFNVSDPLSFVIGRNEQRYIESQKRP